VILNFLVFSKKKILSRKINRRLEYLRIFYSWHENFKFHYFFYKHMLKLSLYYINQNYLKNLENIMNILNPIMLSTFHEYVGVTIFFFNVYH
jgi:hypothetical protein